MTQYTWTPSFFIGGIGLASYWETASDWTPTQYPDSSADDVVIPEYTSTGSGPYNFDVTILAGESIIINTLTLESQELSLDGTLDIIQPFSLGIQNTISLDNGFLQTPVLNLANGSELAGTGTTDVSGNLCLASGSGVGGGTVDVGGIIVNGGDVSATEVTTAGFNNLGELQVASLTTAYFTNTGTVQASNSQIEITDPDAALSAGTLDGNTYIVDGSLTFNGTPIISAIDTNLQLNGTFFSDGQPLQQTLQYIMPDGFITLENSFTFTNSLNIEGTVEIPTASFSGPSVSIGGFLDAETITSSDLNIESGGTVFVGNIMSSSISIGNLGELDLGVGNYDYPPVVLQGAVDDNGVINGVAITLTGAVSGSGIIEDQSEARNEPTTPSISINNSISAGVSVDALGILTLVNPTKFNATIFNFSTYVQAFPDLHTLYVYQNDTIALPTIDPGELTDVSYVGNAAGGTLSLQTDTGSTDLRFLGSYDLSEFMFSGTVGHLGLDIIYDGPACFSRGTQISTPSGGVVIEQLRIGDLVLTNAGEARPIRWIGRRTYSSRFVARSPGVLPVLIRAGALDDGVPRRDLFVSPQHAMYLDCILVSARALVNGATIVQLDAVDHVEYFHIELDTHDVILAEGAPAETFVDDDSRGMFQNAAEYIARYPDALQPPAAYCAPRVTEGYALAAIRERLAVRAGLQPPKAAEPLRGFVDLVEGDRVEGWAQNPAAPEAPVCLDVLVDGALMAQTLANCHRPGLSTSTGDSGRHAFFVRLPFALTPRQSALTEVRRSSDHAPLQRQLSRADLILPRANR